MTIRVLLSWPAAPATPPPAEQLVAVAATLRAAPGWREAEAFGSVDGSGAGFLSALCADGAALSALTTVAEACRAAGPVTTELYRQVRFAHRDGVWVAEPGDATDASRASNASPALHGAHHGTGVRIVIQRAFTEGAEVTSRLLDDVARTRAEAGCVTYAWGRGLEHPQHFLLTELWDSQRRYDEHWALRLASGRAGQRVGGESTPRALGEDTIEFYRHQQFVEQYGRWLPADPERRSTTVQWGI